MPSKRRLTMRHIRQMLRLSAGGTSVREIAVVLGIARSTVLGGAFHRAEEARRDAADPVGGISQRPSRWLWL